MTSQVIIKIVADAFGYPPERLRSQRREARLVRARWVAMYAMRHLLNLSYPHIARELGLRDHTTIMYGLSKIEQSTDEGIIALRDQVMDIASTRPEESDPIGMAAHRVAKQLGALAGVS